MSDNSNHSIEDIKFINMHEELETSTAMTTTPSENLPTSVTFDPVFCPLTLEDMKDEEFFVNENITETVFDPEAELENLKTAIAGYAEDDIFFMSSFGLFFKTTPSSSSDEIQDKICAAGNNSENRMTILVSESVGSSEKLPALIACRDKPKQSFLTLGGLFVKLTQEIRSWITFTSLQEHLKLVQKRFERQKRNVVIIFDNTMPRCNSEFKHIKLVYLPDSIPSPYQSGILHSIKKAYRSKITSMKADNKDIFETYEPEDYVKLLIDSWNELNKTISRYFFHQTNLFGTESLMHVENPVSNEVLDKFSKFGSTAFESFQDFVEFDDNLFTHDPFDVSNAIVIQGEEVKEEFTPIKFNVVDLQSILKRPIGKSLDSNFSPLKKIKIDPRNSSNLTAVTTPKVADDDFIDKAVLISMQQEKDARKVVGSKELCIMRAELLKKANLRTNSSYLEWAQEFATRNHMKFNMLTNLVAEKGRNLFWNDQVLKPTLDKYSSENVYFVGEFAFFYNLLPMKNPPKKFSVIIGLSYDGKRKLPLSVSGSEPGPSVSFLPTTYTQVTNSLVNAATFNDYLKELDEKITSEKYPKILIFCDHALIHMIPTQLKSIVVKHFPPTVISPCRDLSRLLKFEYRRKVLESDLKSIDMIFGLKTITSAWRSVRAGLCITAFLNAGWRGNSAELGDAEMIEKLQDAHLIQDFNNAIGNKFSSFLEYVKADEFLQFRAASTPALILSKLKALMMLKQDQQFPKTKFVPQQLVGVDERRANFLNLLKSKFPTKPASTEATVVTPPTVATTSLTIPKSIIRRVPLPPADEANKNVPKKLTIQKKPPVVVKSVVPNMRRIALQSEKISEIPKKKLNVISVMPKRRKNYSVNTLRRSPYPFHDLAVLRWIEFAQDNKIQITNVKLRKKSLKIAKKLDIKGFVASKKWLERFKIRHSLKDSLLLSAPESGFPEMFHDSNTFIIHIFSLFFRTMPNNCGYINEVMDGNCSNGSHSNERLTVVIGVNTCGTEKLPLIIVGQQKLQNTALFNKLNLNVKYFQNPAAFLKTSVFHAELSSMDRRFHFDNRKVQIISRERTLTDKAKRLNLKNIDLKNRTFRSGTNNTPLSGVVKTLKKMYRSMMVEKLMDAHADGYEVEETNTFEAVANLAFCYDKLSRRSIVESIQSNDQSYTVKTSISEGFEKVNKSFQSFDHYVEFDDYVVCSGKIVKEPEISPFGSEDENEEDIESIEIPSKQESEDFELIDEVEDFLDESLF